MSILKDASMTEDEAISRAIRVMLLFCQVAQADARVRDAFATRTIMMREYNGISRRWLTVD
jgi:hypothetical protein